MTEGENNDGNSDDLHYVSTVDDIKPGKRAVVDIEGQEIAIFNVKGEYHAFLNYCVHQGGPACEGLVSGTLTVNEDFELTYDREDEIIACPWHGWEFDLNTGEHLANSKYSIPSYDIMIDGGDIYIKIP